MRQLHEIDVGCGECDVLRESAPSVESRLPLMRAHLVVAGLADEAAAARAYEGHGHAIADPPSRDLGADVCDGASEFMAGDVREGRNVVVAVPRMPIATAQTGGLDAQDHSVRGWRRVGHLRGSPRSP